MKPVDVKKVIRKLSESVDNLIAVTCSEDTIHDKINEAWLGVLAVYDSEEFKEYRKNAMKVYPMMPADYPGVIDRDGRNVYVVNMNDLMHKRDDLEFEVKTGRATDKSFLLHLSTFKNHITCLELHQDDVNDAFTGNYEKTISSL